MSQLAWLDENLGTIARTEGVRCVVVVNATEEIVPLRAAEVAKPVEDLALALARQLFSAAGDRLTEESMGYRVVVRRVRDSVVGVVADRQLSEGELQRKLNVVAIRAQAMVSREPPSVTSFELRAAF